MKKNFFKKLFSCKNINGLCDLFTNRQLEKNAFFCVIFFIFFYFIIFLLKFFIDRANFSCIWLTIIYLISILSFINYFIYYNKIKKKNISILFLSIYILWAFISCLFSTNKFNSFFGNGYMQEGFFTYLCYFSLFLNSTIILKKIYIFKILKLFSFLGFFLSIFVLISHYFTIDFYHSLEFRPFVSIFYNENHSAYFFMMTYICSIMLYYFSNEKFKFIYLVFSIIILDCLILNSSLGPYLSCVFCLILLFLYLLIKKLNVVKFIIIIFLFIFVSAINGDVNLYNYNGVVSDIKTFNEGIKNNDLKSIDKVGTNRVALWRYGLKFIGEKPIFGYGIETLYEQYSKYDIPDVSSRPHNEFIQIAAFMGIPALILYLLFLFSIFIPILKKLKNCDEIIVMLAFICISYLVSSFVGVSMFYTTPFLFIFLGLISNKEEICKYD